LGVVSLVHSDELVAHKVVARSKSSRNGCGPHESVGDGIAGPDTCVLRTGYETRLVDLDCESNGSASVV
jgi:hypothetical protein